MKHKQDKQRECTCAPQRESVKVKDTILSGKSVLIRILKTQITLKDQQLACNITNCPGGSELSCQISTFPPQLDFSRLKVK